ncbi:MAG: molybdenum cofactor biosynthesis protein MoaE [Pseudomonadota bacterium]
MAVKLSETPFSAWEALASYEAASLAGGSVGACASFVGTMRDNNEGDQVVSMQLEHYPGMTESALSEIEQDAAARWPLLATLIVHRVGDIQIGEPIVLCACWSAHRKAAFEACRFLMEELKSRAPFWKKEVLASGETRWVERNTPGY